MTLDRLLNLLDDVEDPRCGGKVEHRLTDILVIAVCAVIACAESWDDIALYDRTKLDQIDQPKQEKGAGFRINFPSVT